MEGQTKAADNHKMSNSGVARVISEQELGWLDWRKGVLRTNTDSCTGVLLFKHRYTTTQFPIPD